MDVSIFNLLRHIVKQRVGVSMATTFCLGPRSFSTNSRSSRWWRCRNPFCRCLLVENLFVWLFATFGHLAMAFQKFKLNHAPFNVNWTLLEFGLLQNQLWHSGHRWPASVLTRELADLWFCRFLDLSITIWLRRWIVGTELSAIWNLLCHLPFLDNHHHGLHHYNHHDLHHHHPYPHQAGRFEWLYRSYNSLRELFFRQILKVPFLSPPLFLLTCFLSQFQQCRSCKTRAAWVDVGNQSNTVLASPVCLQRCWLTSFCTLM